MQSLHFVLLFHRCALQQFYSYPMLQLTCRHEAAELLLVWWLEIIGAVDTKCLRRMSTHSAYLVFKLKSRTRGLETALASVKYLKEKKSNSDDNQHCQVFVAKRRSPGDSGQFPSSLFDGWMEIKLGEFYVSSGNEGEVEMRFWNTELSLKSGLIVKGIEVRPN